MYKFDLLGAKAGQQKKVKIEEGSEKKEQVDLSGSPEGRPIITRVRNDADVAHTSLVSGHE